MKEIVSRLTPLSVVLIAAFIFILIPFRVIGYGYLPGDDAMRHSAKVISGKDWGQILVLRPEIKMDSHPGWHAILGAVHRMTGWDAHSLVLFSVIFLFFLFIIVPILFLRYPEAWLASLITIAVFSPYIFFRLLLGRPFIVTMTVLLVLCFLWPRLGSKKFPLGISVILTLLVAASTWIHCSWYLYILPIIAFILARQWRACAVFSICAVTGIFIGAALTGHPVIFLKQMLTHLFLAFGNNEAEYMLVSEFRPGLGDTNLVIAVLAVIYWQALRGRQIKDIIDNPVFILAALAFFLGLVTRRVWLDWGFPAIAVWMAQVFNDSFASKIAVSSWRRIPIILALGLVIFMCVTADVGSRWTSLKPVDYISADNPKQAEWLPEPGGIIYSTDMGVFYQIFFRNPHADWRYILGFEPTLMPEEDLEIFRDIQRSPWTYKPLYGWIKKMRPQDRLILRGGPAGPPRIPDLEWNYAALNTWIGRLPRDTAKQVK